MSGMNFEKKIILYVYRMCQTSPVFLPIKMRYKMAKQSNIITKSQIDTWLNGTAAKDAVARGYENQEDSSQLLGQTYTLAAVVRPTMQNPAVAPAPRVPVRTQTSRLQGNGIKASPVEILDSDDELVEELNLTPAQEERIRSYVRRVRSGNNSKSSQ